MNASNNANEAAITIDKATIQPLPNSKKIHVTGSRPDLRVPMREITQSDTPTQLGGEVNPPIYVYDTSGPYSDPEVSISLEHGLAALRGEWISERADTEKVSSLGSAYSR